MMTHNEWSGAQCPIAPDACWIDDATGEHVDASTGARTPTHPLDPERIAKALTEALPVHATTYEHPGYFEIVDASGRRWCLGDRNDTWNGEVYHPGDEDGQPSGWLDTGLAQTVTDPSAIAAAAAHALLADAFDRRIRDHLTPDEYANAIAANRKETDPQVCHTHDFCDANMAMAEAFEEVTGHAADGNDEADAGLWSAAWAAWVKRTNAAVT